MLSNRLSWGRRSGAVLAAMIAGAALTLFVSATPARADDVRNAQMWVLNAVGAPAAWKLSQGQGVTVAVIDSGVYPGVSDLAGSVTGGPDYTGVHTPESNPDWGVHGTWMASLIAGHGHDGGSSGILGIAPKARVLSIRVITDGSDPGYSRYVHEPQSQVQGALADAIKYAVSHGVGVISMSLGYGTPSLQVQEALEDAFSHGVVVVASSGNSGGTSGASHQGHAPYSFPADYLGVIGVAALNQNGGPAGFSSDNISVLVAAPGVDVPAQGRDGQYWLVSGTSPACALTAGVAALIKSADPSLPADLVRKAIWSTTTHRPQGGYNEDVGFGTVNAPAALAAAAQMSASGPGTTDRGSSGPHSHPAPPGGSGAPGTSSGASPDSTTSPGSSALWSASNVSQLTGGIGAGAHFGGGPQAVPPSPVGPRGTRQLVLLCLLALASMAVIAITMSHLATGRRAPSPATRRPGGSRPGGIGPDRTGAAMRHPPTGPPNRSRAESTPGPSAAAGPGLLPGPSAAGGPGLQAAGDPAALPGPVAWGGRVVSAGSLTAVGPTPSPDPLAESGVEPMPDSLAAGGAEPSAGPLAAGGAESLAAGGAEPAGPPGEADPSPPRRFPWSSRPPGRHAFPKNSLGPREPGE
jgi:subtilisin family serine protease